MNFEPFLFDHIFVTDISLIFSRYIFKIQVFTDISNLGSTWKIHIQNLKNKNKKNLTNIKSWFNSLQIKFTNFEKPLSKSQYIYISAKNHGLVDYMQNLLIL